MEDNSTASMQNSYPMNGGNGTYSYSKNSSVQREASVHAKAIIEEVIAEKLDIKSLSSTSNTIRIADLGCSIGPNTFISVQHIIEAVENKFRLKGLSTSQSPEFQVFFNDQTTNDFNTLFLSLPSEKQYFVAGVPGSFHGQLFPGSSIQIVHSSFAFHWLSKTPKEVLRRDSPAWNRGKIFYTSASDEVANAYVAQFARDINSILNARAKELVVGGLMLLLLVAAPDDRHYSQIGLGLFYDALGSSLMDMANEGLISEDQVDTFNLPMYITTPKEIAGLIKNNGCFSIEKMKLIEPDSETYGPIDTQKHVTHIRAAFEGTIAAHFGAEIIDDLFLRFNQKAAVFRDLDMCYRKGNLLFLALMRK